MIQINKPTIILILAVLFAIPSYAKADFDFGRLIDPACFFACKDDNRATSVTNSYNTNSNINSNNVTVNSPTGTTNVVTTRNEVGKPVNTSIDDYYNYNNNYNNSLYVSCYPTSSSGNIGDTIVWRASVNGGNGNYGYSWSGTDGLSSSGSSASRTYRNPGTKTASVTVSSGNQTVSQSCSGSVRIYDDVRNDYYYDDYYYRNNYNNYYRDNTYYYNYTPLYVSCYADRTVATTDSPINWTANVTGGNGSYSYSWSGTDILRGYNRINSVNYHSLGTKTASVTVTSGSQTVTQYCSNSVNINQIFTPNYSNNYPYNYNTANIYNYQNTNGIQVACYADKTSSAIGSPVVWSVEAVGGNGVFNYIWSGSENLTGNQASVLKTYGTPGSKTAMVTAIASNGQSVSQACGNSVSIKSNTVAKAKSTTVATKSDSDSDSSVVASIVALKNVPWISVAILMIFIMFFTIIYLIFNKTKI